MNDFVHALFTTGRAQGDIATYGSASWWEFVHKISMVPAYFHVDQAGNVYRSQLALSLDRSEKVALSYYTGQAMTALFCSKILNVDYLMHMDRYASRFRITFGPTNQRPDLFGMDSVGGWVVAEAKGRSNGMESALQAKIRAQKGNVRQINGSPPALSLGCVAMFPTAGNRDGRLRLKAIDPPPSESASDIEIELSDFYRSYYAPWVAGIKRGAAAEVGPYIVSSFDGLGLEIGMLRKIYDALTNEQDATIDLAELLTDSDLSAQIRESDFKDGTLIEVDWDEQVRSADKGAAW